MSTIIFEKKNQPISAEKGEIVRFNACVM